MTDRLYKTAALTSSAAAGSLFDTFMFQQVPMASVWTGTIQVIASPPTAFHRASVNGIIWAEWIGYQPSPTIQAIGGETMQIDSYGLVPRTAYQASLIGSTDVEDSYLPVWPLSSNFDINAATPIKDITIPIQIAGAVFSQAISVPQAGSVLQIQFVKTAGTATGFILKVANNADLGLPTFVSSPGVTYQTTYPRAGATQEPPWWYVPISNPSYIPIITITPLLNGVIGGTYQGILRISFGNGTLYIPVLQPVAQNQLSPTGGVGLQSETQVGTAANVLCITDPASVTSGTIIRVRRVVCTPIVAPAAIAAVTLRGTTSGAIYWRDVVNANLLPSQTSGICDFYVAAAVRDDPAEGLQGFNGASQTVVFNIEYDLVPYPQGITDAT